VTGDYKGETAETTAGEPPAASDCAHGDATRVGGWDPEPPATAPEKIISDPISRDRHRRDRRVVAQGVPRGEIDQGLIIQALLMIAKDRERGDQPAISGN
jgi:hypothetical protein